MIQISVRNHPHSEAPKYKEISHIIYIICHKSREALKRYIKAFRTGFGII